MNTRTALILCLLGALAPVRGAATEPEGRVSLEARLNTNRLPHRGGTVFLYLTIDAAGFRLPDRSYEPMNIAVVLDRSGSMADERKLEYAKKALYELVDRLSSADMLTIIMYDDRVETLLPAQRVTDKRRIRQRIREVTPGGSTNLGGGLKEGIRQIQRSFGRGGINRVILLSDGLANVGIVDPHRLNGMAEKARGKEISLTTIGVGLDYNENLMLGLARHGGGNYYFVESPSQLASIFERELHDVRMIVARNVRIEFSLGRGVEFMDAIGYEASRSGSSITIPLGDITSADRRELCVELTVPEGSGALRVVRGSLRTDSDVRCDGEITPEVRYTDDAAELRQGRDWDVQPKVDIAVSTRQVDRAMEALDEGRSDEAGLELEQAAGLLRSSEAAEHNPAAAPLIESQVSRLRSYARQLKDSTADVRRLKKSMQYDNYGVQSKKKP